MLIFENAVVREALGVELLEGELPEDERVLGRDGAHGHGERKLRGEGEARQLSPSRCTRKGRDDAREGRGCAETEGGGGRGEEAGDGARRAAAAVVPC